MARRVTVASDGSSVPVDGRTIQSRMHAGNEQGEWAQPFDLGDGLEPVVLTRTRGFEAWPRFFGGLFDWFAPMMPSSLLRAIGGLVLFLSLSAALALLERAYGSVGTWTGAIAAILLVSASVSFVRRKSKIESRRESTRSVTIDVRHAEPSSRLRVIGEREKVAEVVGHLPATDQMFEPVFLECAGVYGFADRIEDLAASARRVIAPPRVSKRLHWSEIAVRATCGFVLFASFFAGSQMVPGVHMGFWGVLLSGVCAWMLITAFNPVTIRVMPGRVDVFQTELFRRSRVTQTTFDLTRARVILDVNRGVVRVEDPGRTTWPGLYMRFALGSADTQSMACVLNAARTRHVAPNMPAGALLA